MLKPADVCSCVLLFCTAQHMQVCRTAGVATHAVGRCAGPWHLLCAACHKPKGASTATPLKQYSPRPAQRGWVECGFVSEAKLVHYHASGHSCALQMIARSPGCLCEHCPQARLLPFLFDVLLQVGVHSALANKMVHAALEAGILKPQVHGDMRARGAKQQQSTQLSSFCWYETDVSRDMAAECSASGLERAAITAEIQPSMLTVKGQGGSWQQPHSHANCCG